MLSRGGFPFPTKQIIYDQVFSQGRRLPEPTGYVDNYPSAMCNRKPDYCLTGLHKVRCGVWVNPLSAAPAELQLPVTQIRQKDLYAVDRGAEPSGGAADPLWPLCYMAEMAVPPLLQSPWTSTWRHTINNW